VIRNPRSIGCADPIRAELVQAHRFFVVIGVWPSQRDRISLKLRYHMDQKVKIRLGCCRSTAEPICRSISAFAGRFYMTESLPRSAWQRTRRACRDQRAAIELFEYDFHCALSLYSSCSEPKRLTTSILNIGAKAARCRATSGSDDGNHRTQWHRAGMAAR
jgi:hypothetical protein